MEQGFSEPIVADSGNGCHLHFPIDLPHDAETTELVKAITAEVSTRFTDNVVKIDVAVFNAARITRLYGTVACKGDDTEERPHRRSSLLHVPDYLQNGWSQKDAIVRDTLAGIVVAPSPNGAASVSVPATFNLNGAKHQHFSADRLDLRQLLTTRGIEFRESEGSAAYPVKLHVDCPFNANHKGKDAYAAQRDSGALIFHCSHDSCSGNGWQQFKAAVGIETKQQSNRFFSGVDVDGLNAGNQAAFVDTIADFEPFPVHELPEPLARFCSEVSVSVGCDPSFPAMATLAVCSAAIGTSRQVCIKRGWFAPGIVWTLLVGESGTQKSPPFRLAMAPLKERQQRDAEAFSSAHSQYLADMRSYKRELRRWEKKPEGDEPERPVPPVRNRCIVQDATIEALAPILNENSRGVLMTRDELSGWLAGFDRYSSKSSASSEVPKWLEIYNCESITIDRKTGDERFLFIRRPFVSITGGIQPKTLCRVLTEEHKDNGLQSRLLMTYPPRQPKAWRDDEVSSATQSAYGDLIRSLFGLQPEIIGDDSRPSTLMLNDAARELYKNYVNRTGTEQAAMNGHLASQWSKLEETPARLAVILHCIRQVTSGVECFWTIDEVTMNAAVNLAEWFKNETLRIGRLLTEPDEIRQSRHLASWIESQGGVITARDLCRCRRDIATSDQAELLLMKLVELKLGSWRGNHRSREFVLHRPVLSTNGT
jgi:hypothetical protein